jgi:hypothetical protein
MQIANCKLTLEEPGKTAVLRFSNLRFAFCILQFAISGNKKGMPVAASLA